MSKSTSSSSSSSWTFKNNPADKMKSMLAFQQSLQRTKSIQGAINVKRKRQALQASSKALVNDNLEAWSQVNKRKRIISTPMSRLLKCEKAINRVKNSLPAVRDGTPAQKDTEKEKGNKKKGSAPKKYTISADKLTMLHKNIEKMQMSIQEAIGGVTPIAMDLKKCQEKQKVIEEKMVEMTRQGNDLDRALMRACQSIFNNEPSWMYANEDFINQIIPSSMYHQRTWTKNKREEKKKNASGLHTPGNTMKGNTAGNLKSKKPSGKVEINAKKLASKERQDMPDSISEHTPICVADPDSFSGLMGAMMHQKRTKGYNRALKQRFDNIDDDDHDYHDHHGGEKSLPSKRKKNGK